MKFCLVAIAVLVLVLHPLHVPAQQTEMQHDYAAAQQAMAAGDVDRALSMF